MVQVTQGELFPEEPKIEGSENKQISLVAAAGLSRTRPERQLSEAAIDQGHRRGPLPSLETPFATIILDGDGKIDEEATRRWHNQQSLPDD